jgi:hypothetical protein
VTAGDAGKNQLRERTVRRRVVEPGGAGDVAAMDGLHQQPGHDPQEGRIDAGCRLEDELLDARRGDLGVLPVDVARRGEPFEVGEEGR